MREDFPEYNDFPTHDPHVLPHEYGYSDLATYFPAATAPDAEDADDLDADDWKLAAPPPHEVIKHRGKLRARRS